MEWKTAKELAAELGVSSNAIYDAAKRSGCVRGMRITKRGALYSGTPKDGVNAPRGPKHRIPKPPLTIVEEATGEEGQGDIEALRKELLDKIDWVDACRKVDAEGLGRKVDRLNERLDLWTIKLEDVDKSVSQYIDRELTRRFDVDSTESVSSIGKRLEHHISNDHQEEAEALESRLKALEHNSRTQQQRIIQLEKHDSVERMIERNDESRERVEDQDACIGELILSAKASAASIEMLQTGLTDAEIERIGMRERIQDLYDHYDQHAKRVSDKVEMRLLSLESFEQEFARRVFALEGTVSKDMQEFKRDTVRSIEVLEGKVDLHWKNVRTLLGIDSAKKAPSVEEIMKRAVKAASAFADAMKGDL